MKKTENVLELSRLLKEKKGLALVRKKSDILRYHLISFPDDIENPNSYLKNHNIYDIYVVKERTASSTPSQ